MVQKVAPISVAVRLRPFVPRERGEEKIVTIRRNQVSLTTDKGTLKEYAFDAAFDSTDPSDPDYASQEKVYNEFGKNLLENCLGGYNSTVFAYGQTGTGKTTTIMGSFEPVSEQGILLRLMHDLFEASENLRVDGYRTECRARMLEIYNEKVHDLLLAPGQAKKNLDVRVHPKLGVYVPNLTESAVATFRECADLINFGNTMKTVAATAMNAKSSRAHTVFVIRFEKNDGQDLDTSVSEMFFVDLAGRENERTTCVKGERLVELSFINKSLFHLSNCIHSLGEPSGGHSSPSSQKESHESPRDRSDTDQAHDRHDRQGSKEHDRQGSPHENPPLTRRRSQHGALDSSTKGGKPTLQRQGSKSFSRSGTHRAGKPDATVKAQFRNSKLTLLLSEALTGNSRTAMIGTLSPAAVNLDENQSTLNFAATVKSIKLEASASSVNKKDLVASLQEELKLLKEQLAKGGGAQTPGVEGGGEAELQEKLHATQALCSQYQKSWEDSQREAAEAMEQRKEVMTKMGLSMWKNLAKHRREAREGPELPILSNISDDPHLAGTIVYHVPPGAEMSVGSADGNDFVLAGLGIGPRICYLRNEDGVLSIRLAWEGEGRSSRVEINEEALIGKEAIALSHNDKVVLGRSREFKVFTEKGEVSTKPTIHKRTPSRVANEIEEVRLLLGEERANDPAKLSMAKQIRNEMENQHRDAESTIAFRAWLRNAKRAKRLVDEANDITDALRRQDHLRFELTQLTPLLACGYEPAELPIFGVRLVRHMSLARRRWQWAIQQHMTKRHGLQGIVKNLDNFGHANLDSNCRELSLWTFPRFQGRMQLMRDAYEAWTSDPDSFTLDPQFDPWKETGPAEAALLVSEVKDDLNQRTESLRELQSEMLELNKLFDKERRERDEEVAKYKEAQMVANGREQELMWENTTLAKQNSELKMQLEKAKAKETPGREASEALNKDLEKQHSDLQVEYKALRLSLANAQTEIQRMSMTQELLQREKGVLEGEAHVAKAETSQLRSQMKSLRNEIQTLHEDIRETAQAERLPPGVSAEQLQRIMDMSKVNQKLLDQLCIVRKRRIPSGISPRQGSSRGSTPGTSPYGSPRISPGLSPACKSMNLTPSSAHSHGSASYMQRSSGATPNGYMRSGHAAGSRDAP